MERAPIAEVQPSLATFGCKVNLFPLTRPEGKNKYIYFDGWGFIRTFAAEGCETACARQSMPASLPSLNRSILISIFAYFISENADEMGKN